MHSQQERGFIALISVIIISAILLMMVFTVGLSSFLNRFDALDAENKRESLSLAEACVSSAMLRTAKGLSSTNVCVNDLGGTCGGSDPQKVCKICSVTGTNPATVITRAVYNGAFTTLRVTFDTNPGSFAVTGWDELSGGYPTCTVP